MSAPTTVITRDSAMMKSTSSASAIGAQTKAFMSALVYTLHAQTPRRLHAQPGVEEDDAVARYRLQATAPVCGTTAVDGGQHCGGVARILIVHANPRAQRLISILQKPVGAPLRRR